MSANTQVLEQGASGGMNVEGWCVLAMGALFGLFLLGVWWELRRNLRQISGEAQKRERAIVRLESRAAFERELAREAASKRMAALRAASVEPAQVLGAQAPEEREEEAARGFGLESVGRILERLAQAAPQIEDEVEAPAFGTSARPALNMVRGGKSSAKSAGKASGSHEAAGSSEEVRGNAAQGAASRRSRGAASTSTGSRGKARDGVKSSSIGSGALFASR